MFDVAVIGGGIMGAPAARLLAEAGMRVAVVASPEPDDPAVHDGPFGAHYDVSRLTWLSHSDPVETDLSVRSQAAMAALDGPDSDILTSTGSLFVSAPGRDEGRLDAAQLAGHEILDATQLRLVYPFLRFPEDVRGFDDISAPGIMNPRAVVSADLRGAMVAGATMFSTYAIEVIDGASLEIRLADGRRWQSSRVLVAAGAFSNRSGLLPRSLALRMKQETMLLARMDDQEAAKLRSYPATVYQLAADEISDVYSGPPMRYPDGWMYLKWGCNTLADRWLQSVVEIGDWYRAGDSDSPGKMIRPHMEAFIPGLAANGWRTHRCAVTYTAHGKPYIDEIEKGRVYVAVGGNGHSAKWSPVLGMMAADLILHGAWDATIPRDPFRAVFLGEETGWEIRDLLRDRVRSS